MPLNDEGPSSSSSSSSTSTSASEDQSSDTEVSDRCDSINSTTDIDFSRQSFNSSSSKHSSPSGSPPKTITLEEVMSSAHDLSNLKLAHEIIVNRNFRVEPKELPENSLQKRVKEIVHKAFWDCLEADLNEDPPEYQHAISLLEEIREILLSFLNPGANRMRSQIQEILDMDLIRQQARNDAVDIPGLAAYIINTMGKMCAPVRDDEIKRLRDNTSGDIVSLFKEIFRVLDLMMMDIVNVTIMMIRPELQKNSVEYEREKFQNILQNTPSALDNTTAWISASLEEALQMSPPGGKSVDGKKDVKTLPSPALIITNAFLRLLLGTHVGPLPETLVMDEGRVVDLQRRAQLLQAVGSVLLIVYNAIGEAITGLPALAERLKRMTSVLLEGMHSPNFNLVEALENATVQICCELNKSLTERQHPALPAQLQHTLKGQICAIAQESNPMRTLVEARFQQYIRLVLSVPGTSANPPPTPNGLALIQPELALVAFSYAALANFNKQVYLPFYMGIIKNLLFGEPTQPATETNSSSGNGAIQQEIGPSNVAEEPSSNAMAMK